jgi:hypothetical protein
MYWLTRMDSLRDLLRVVGVLSAVVGIVATIFLIVTYVSTLDGDKFSITLMKSRLFRWLGPVVSTFALVIGLTYALVPSTKEYAAIKVIPMILSSENTATARKDSGALYNLAVEWAKEQLKADVRQTEQK